MDRCQRGGLPGPSMCRIGMSTARAEEYTARSVLPYWHQWWTRRRRKLMLEMVRVGRERQVPPRALLPLWPTAVRSITQCHRQSLTVSGRRRGDSMLALSTQPAPSLQSRMDSLLSRLSSSRSKKGRGAAGGHAARRSRRLRCATASLTARSAAWLAACRFRRR